MDLWNKVYSKDFIDISSLGPHSNHMRLLKMEELRQERLYNFFFFFKYHQNHQVESDKPSSLDLYNKPPLDMICAIHIILAFTTKKTPHCLLVYNLPDS